MLIRVGTSRMAYGFERSTSATRPAGVAEITEIGVRMFIGLVHDRLK